MKWASFNFLFFALFAMFSSSCRDRTDGVLAEESFTIYINVNEPAYFDITVPTGWIYYNGGNVGLIIYRTSATEFMAYDIRSPYNVSDDCTVNVTGDNVIIEDPCSGSQWLIIDGSIVNGPTQYPLLSYATTFNETTGLLTVYN